MNKPSVILISYHFFPSNEIGARRTTAIANFLVERNLRVVVISAFGGRDIKYGAEVLPGVIAVPVRRPPRMLIDKMVALKRKFRRSAGAQEQPPDSTPAARPPSPTSFLARMRDLFFRILYFIDDYKSWGRRALRAATREGRKCSQPLFVLSSSPPLTMLWVGALAARRLKVPHVADLRDPWADTIAQTFPDRLIDLALARRIEGWAMRSAAAIISTTSNLRQLLLSHHPELASKIFIVRNGYDDVFHRTPPETGGRLAILFAGELYMHRDPFPLLRALERLLSSPHVDATKISMTFMGRTGTTGHAALNWVIGKRCAAIVRFLPPQPPENVSEATMASTVLLNLAQQQPLSVPAKTYEHLASGRENLLLCENDSESALLVANIPGVIQVDPQDESAMDRALLDLYERHVNSGRLRAPAERDVTAYSRATAHEALWHVIRSVATVSL